MKDPDTGSSPIKVRKKGTQQEVYDPVRKKYVLVTPEEQVRQLIIHYLCSEKGYPLSLMEVEKQIKVHRLVKRVDIIAYNAKGEKILAVECKAPHVRITQATFDQLANYNISLKVPYLMVTNGQTNYYARIDYERKTYTFLEDLPHYSA